MTSHGVRRVLRDDPKRGLTEVSGAEIIVCVENSEARLFFFNPCTTTWLCVDSPGLNVMYLFKVCARLGDEY
jgi:hypothetical protein